MNNIKLFQKKIEDFTCSHCGAEVVGNGYTNHCPKCLWSQHVDIHPGDRASTCKGMMKPVKVENNKNNEWILIHECIICGYQKRNKVSADDDVSKVITIAKSFAEKVSQN